MVCKLYLEAGHKGLFSVHAFHRFVPHGLLEVALREELGVDELGRLLGVGPVLGLRSIADDSKDLFIRTINNQ